MIQRHPRGPTAIEDQHHDFDLVAAITAKRPAWMKSALCASNPDVNFFPDRGESLTPALTICGLCEVLIPCREWALSAPANDHGILGGMSANARQHARKNATKRKANAS